MNVTKETIRETLKHFIVTNFLANKEQETLTYDTPLISGGLIDSILTMQVVVFIEKTYQFDFAAHEVDRDNLNTINLMTDFIDKKINGKG